MMKSFKQIAEDLDEIIARYTGLPDKSDDLLDEIREEMTIAGKMLHKMLNNNRLPPPETPSPWYRFIFNDDGSRFQRIMYPDFTIVRDIKENQAYFDDNDEEKDDYNTQYNPRQPIPIFF